MEFREIGKTGRTASVIGLGCEHLDRKPYETVSETVNAALDYGVNILDVFMPGKEIRENIAKALGNRRRDVMIQGHLGSTDLNQQYDISRDMHSVRKYFEDLLRLFGGYIDFGMLFFIDSDRDYEYVFEKGIADYALRLKEQGCVGHIGFSSHNPETAIKAINTGLPEMLMFSINPAFDMLPAEEYVLDRFETGISAGLLKGIDHKRARLYQLCAKKQIGITAMKTFCAGKLLSPIHTPFAGALTTAQCINYALSRPAVASVLPGCQTAAEVRDVMRFFELGAEARSYAEIIGSVRGTFKGNCVYCSHCLPCPSGIDIAAVCKCLDIARTEPENIPRSVRAVYSCLARDSGECTACGCCEARCPFGVPVIGNIAEAARLFACP